MSINKTKNIVFANDLVQRTLGVLSFTNLAQAGWGVNWTGAESNILSRSLEAASAHP